MIHSVRARLASGWHEQVCDDDREAVAIFDRLRAINPRMQLQRIIAGRVVEVAGIEGPR